MHTPINVLFIEDNPGDARLVREELSLTGSKTMLQLEWVDRLEKGLEQLAAKHIHAVLLDLNLPDSQGLDTLQRVVSYAPHIPVIIMTGQADEAVAIEAVQAGAQDYLVKGQVDGRLLTRSIQYGIQRKQAEDALRESEERFRLVVESAPSAMIVVDRKGRISLANSQAENLFGYTISELLGQPIELLIPSHFREDHRQLHEEYLARPQAIAIGLRHNVYGLHKRGHEIPLEIGLAPYESSEGLRVLALINDITERKQAQEELQTRTLALARSNRLIVALSNVAARLAISPDMRVLMETLGQELKQLNLEVVIALLEPDAQALRVDYVTAAGPALTLAQNMTGISLIGFRIERARWPGFARVVDERLPSFLPDSLEFVMSLISLPLPRSVLRQALKLVNVTSDTPILCLPLLVNERAMGAMMIWGPDLQESDGAAGLIFCAHIAAALENARLYESAQRELGERKQAEENLREAEFRYRTLVEQIPAITYRATLDSSKPRTYISPQVEPMLGYSPAESLADPDLWRRIVHPDDYERVMAKSRNFYETGEPFAAEYRLQRRDGRIVWVNDQATIARAEDGRALFIQGIQMDITERKEAEKALQKSETRYRLATRATNDVIWEWSAETGELIWSENALHVFGYSPDEVGHGETWWDDHLHPDDRQRVLSKMNALFQGDESIWSEEYRFLLTDGSYAHVSDHGYVERDPDGNPVRMIGAMANISERKGAEARIQRQLERLNALREIDHAIASTFDMQVSLNVLLSRTVNLLAVDAAAILLLKAPLNTLEYEATLGFHTAAPQGFNIRLGKSYAGEAALEKRLVQIPDLRREPDPLFVTGAWKGEGFVSYYGAPLITKGKVVGVLEVFGRSPVRRDEEWFDFLNTLAGQAAIAIDNAQLFAVSQRELAERRIAEDALRISHAELERRVEERTAELSRVNLELERSLRIKDEFLANMSHELRTPLNAIIGLSESLEEQTAGSLNEKQDKYVHMIGESGHHLLELINDILDIAKIESGQFTLDRRKLDVKSICESSLRMIRPLAQKKNQELVLDLEASQELIWADERRLKQMLVNLLNNAVKFTPEQGGIGLEVRGNKEANTVTFTVWDTGIGIQEEDLASLFQPFVQLKSEVSHKNAGTGLGLALVAQMARLHGGSVGVESQPGKGSRFSITLPWESYLAADSTSRMKMTGRSHVVKPDNRGEKLTILLVEDTEEVIMVIRDYLEYTGYKVAVARNGVDGIVLAKQFHPDLVLMDIQMPDMDGLEATRQLRCEAGFEHTPILALTALAMKGDRERCLAAGMDEYISKPVNLKALVNIIQSFV